MSPWHTLRMPLDEFIPAVRKGLSLSLGVRVLQAALAVQTASSLNWYDMLRFFGSTPASVAA